MSDDAVLVIEKIGNNKKQVMDQWRLKYLMR
jgi:hypothetical protein